MLIDVVRRFKRGFGAFLLLVFVGSGTCDTTAVGAPTTLDFSEIPFQSVDDLAYAGVTFDFKVNGVDSSDAFYNSFGPGALTYVDDPSLTGDAAGILRLDFDSPTSVINFGLALNTASALSPGFRVELFSPNLTPLGETLVDVFPTAGALGFSENRFQYSGAPVSRAVIRFDLQPGNFALDNLSFQPVPEPTTFVFSTIALLAFVFLARRSIFRLGRCGQ